LKTTGKTSFDECFSVLFNRRQNALGFTLILQHARISGELLRLPLAFVRFVRLIMTTPSYDFDEIGSLSMIEIYNFLDVP